MTILGALAARYDKLASMGDAPLLGYAPTQISFTIVIDATGRYVTTRDERVAYGKKRRPRLLLAPAAPIRTQNVSSGAFWDKTSYALGRTLLDESVSPDTNAKGAGRLVKEHAAFLARHTALLADVDDLGCQAFLQFLLHWSPDQYDELTYASDMLDQNIAFSLQDEPGFIHDRPAAREALAAASTLKTAKPAMCLVTGRTAPVARIHPLIKGVIGSQTSGATLVSFARDAFVSYGQIQGESAPISETAAFAYTTALNALLMSSGGGGELPPVFCNRVLVGETTVVFWAEHEGIETFMRAMLGDGVITPRTGARSLGNPTDTERAAVLQKIQTGLSLNDAAPEIDAQTKVYVLGLSPSGARLSVRFWAEQTFEDFTINLQQHWKDLSLDPMPRIWPPPLESLLMELAPRHDPEAISPHLAGETVRSILTGRPYPRALLTLLVIRLRADQDSDDRLTGRRLEKVGDLRVALIKASLARMHRWKQVADKVPVSLDITSTNQAYRLGRLFAVFERLQSAATGRHSGTLRNIFYVSASSTPALVFPQLFRNARHHSRSVRLKHGAALENWFQNYIREIALVLEGCLPKRLLLEEQGYFALGHYHQRSLLGRRSDLPGEPTAAEATEDRPINV